MTAVRDLRACRVDAAGPRLVVIVGHCWPLQARRYAINRASHGKVLMILNLRYECNVVLLNIWHSSPVAEYNII